MIKTVASNINPDTIQSIRSSPHHLMTRTVIHTCARVSQIVFASGCFLATLQIPYCLFQILTGGFIFILGPKMVLQAVPIIAYYDLAKISSNIASLFQSRVILQFVNDHANQVPYGKQIAQCLEDCESGFSLPNGVTNNITGAESIAKAVTHETIVAHNFAGILAKSLEG